MRKEKVRETDYQNAERPKTRLAQYFDIFKHRFLELLKISLLQTVFNIPLFVSLILFYALVRNATDYNSLMTVFLIQGASFLISVPCVYAGMTGTLYCMKKLAFAEGEFASSSFFIGLREEWKSGLLIGLIQGISASIALIGSFFFYTYMTEINPVIAGFGITIMAIQLIVVLMVCYYAVAQMVTYTNKMRFVLKNSFIMALMRFPFNLLFLIIYPGIVIALWSIMDITMFVGVGLMVFFVAFGHLLWTLNAISAFDKYINKEQYPDYYRLGLAKQINETKEV